MSCSQPFKVESTSSRVKLEDIPRPHVLVNPDFGGKRYRVDNNIEKTGADTIQNDCHLANILSVRYGDAVNVSCQPCGSASRIVNTTGGVWTKKKAVNMDDSPQHKAYARCDICILTFSTHDFKLLSPCGHFLCNSCINKIFPRQSGTCPFCRASITKKNFKTILLNIVPASVALTESVIEGLALMDENARLVSVLKPLNEAAEILNVDRELARPLKRSIADFRERLVPLFNERKEQRKQIDKLQSQLEESTAKLRSLEDMVRANRKTMEVESERTKNEALKERLAALEKQINTLMGPFWTVRLVALALISASAIVNVSLGLNAAIKAKLANQMNNKMSPFIASLVTFSEQDRKVPIRIDLNAQDIAQASVAVTSVSAFIAVSCSLMMFFHLRGSLSSLTPRYQGAFLALCGALLFASLDSYAFIYQSRRATVAVSVFSIRVPNYIVQIAQNGLGIHSKYNQIDFLRLMAILPWFTILFSVMTAGLLLVAV